MESIIKKQIGALLKLKGFKASAANIDMIFSEISDPNLFLPGLIEGKRNLLEKTFKPLSKKNKDAFNSLAVLQRSFKKNFR